MHNGVIDGPNSLYRANRGVCQYGKYEEHKQNLVKDFEYCQTRVENNLQKQCTRDIWIKQLQVGPMVVAMDAEFPGFSLYKPGDDFAPANPSTCGKLNHALVAVGLVTENDVDYFLIRNSWGANWGKDGYFKIPALNACGLAENAWVPHVQQDKPFPASKCPTFGAECQFTGKTMQTCYGERDFDTSPIAGSPQAYKYQDNNYGGLTFNFYKDTDCEGDSDWNYENDLQCFNDSFFYKNTFFKSASADTMDLPWGCIMHFSKTCYSGKSTLICDSIPDLTKTDFIFTKGSMYINDTQIKNIIFFDDIKYTGNGFGIKGNTMLSMKDTDLNEKMKRAKSVLINVRPPSEKLDPDW